MKICHIINSLNRGGAETHLLDLCKEQVSNGLNVEVISIGQDKDNIFSVEKGLSNLNIKIHRLNGPRMFNPISYIKLKNLIKDKNYDIVHSHQPRSDYMIFLLKRIFKNSLRFKWIVSIHGKYNTYLDESFMNKLKLIFFKYLYKAWENADQLIVISKEVEDWIRKLNSNLKPVVVNYWISNKNVTKNLSNDRITFGFLGRLNKNKGIEDLIDSLNFVNIDFNCIVGGIGSTDYRQYLNSKILEKNKQKIKFLGYVENQENFFNSIDVFIFPSYSEGLGLVLLEALSYKKLCITRNNPPMNQFVSNDNGYLFNNLEDLISQIELAYKEYNIESIYSDKIKNIEMILKKYDVKVIYPMIEKVYRL
jgi:glycosyltransferase involved in cell wall biosynthesis